MRKIIINVAKGRLESNFSRIVTVTRSGLATKTRIKDGITQKNKKKKKNKVQNENGRKGRNGLRINGRRIKIKKRGEPREKEREGEKEM